MEYNGHLKVADSIAPTGDDMGMPLGTGFFQEQIEMQIHQETQRFPGPDVVINCPACEKKKVAAKTYDQETQEKLYGLLQVNNVRSTWIVCSKCKAKMRSRLSTEELKGKSADQLSSVMYFDAGFIPNMLAILALLVAVFPMAGTGMAAIAYFANRESRTWSRKASLIALWISFVPLALIGGGILIAMIGGGFKK